MGWFFLLFGLYLIIFSKRYSKLAAWRYGSDFMPASDWRIMIVFMGCGACLLSVLVLAGIIALKS
jgi:hypothetical protein